MGGYQKKDRKTVGRFRKVDIRTWNDAKVRSLSPDGKLIWVFLLTHPNQTSLGIFKTSISGLADELGMELKRFREGFAEGFSKGLFYYDETACCLAIPRYLKYNPPENPNVVKSWTKLIDLIPECGLKRFYFQVVKWFVEQLGEGFAEGLPKPFREPYAESLNPEPYYYIPPTPPKGGSESPSLKKGRRTRKPTPSGNSFSPEFAAFWSAYPNRRGGKQKAWEIWRRLEKSGSLPAIDDLIGAVKKLAESPKWVEDNGRFIPMATTFLHRGRWTDVEALSSGTSLENGAPPTQADPNCEFCHGRGLEEAVSRDGSKHGMKICRCRTEGGHC